MMKEGKVEIGGGHEEAHMGKGKGKLASIRGIAIMDLILRIAALVGTLGSAAAMATTDQTLPFFTQIVRFEAQYDDFTTFKWVLFSFFRVN